MPSLKVACERMRYWCEEANLGYDQDERYNIFPGGETDCSALVIHVLQEAGFDTGSASYTGNMSSELCARGGVRLPANISDARPGDVLLNDARHTCLVIEGYGGDATIGQASIDERGKARGGQTGDQTGRETNVSPIYEYGAGGDCILRYAGETDDDSQEEEVEKLQRVYNGGGNVYRLYNPNGMHFYTLSTGEREALVNAGGSDEGVAGVAPKSAEYPIYRMYNPGNGDHLYSTSADSCEDLQAIGGKAEGVPFFTNDSGTPVYRLYNPNSGEHFYTTSSSERDNLSNAGGNYEGVAFYAL